MLAKYWCYLRLLGRTRRDCDVIEEVKGASQKKQQVLTWSKG